MMNIKKQLFLITTAIILSPAVWANPAVTFNINDKTGLNLKYEFRSGENHGIVHETGNSFSIEVDDEGKLYRSIDFLQDSVNYGPNLYVANEPLFGGNNFLVTNPQYATYKAELSQEKWDGKSNITVEITFSKK